MNSAQGEAPVNELKWVHRLIRHDLQIAAKLAVDLRDGLAGEDAAEAIGALQTSSPALALSGGQRLGLRYY
jgi:hypothetical protein